MSFGGQFEDATEVERQLQEELRRRQQALGVAGAQQSAAFSALARARASDYAHLGILGDSATSQFYQRPPHSPYGHAPNAYAGLPLQYGADQGAQGSLARFYEEQRRQQQVAQQAVQANYAAQYGQSGIADPRAYAAPYGMPPAATAPSPYTQEMLNSQAAQTQSATPSQDPYLQQYIRDRDAAVHPSQIVPTPSGSMPSPSIDASTPMAKSPPTVPSSRTPTKTPAPRKPRSTPTKSKKMSAFKEMKASRLNRVIDGSIIKDAEGNATWYTGCVPLGLEDDKYWLSELQVYLRANFAEAFGATEEDIAAPMHGRNKPIALGQVGIRCMHCKSDNPAERGQQATSYPSLISGIYNSVQQMLRLHLDCCLAMPTDVRHKIEALKVSCSSRGGRKQYWIDSAKRLGLVDTPHGIHFGRDPLGPLPPLTGPSVNSKEGRKKKMEKCIRERDEAKAAAGEDVPKPVPPVDTRPLVFPEDKPLISDYLYLTLEQMAPCLLMEADRVGCYKTRKVGFPGLACKHCVGQAGCGRYFPASEASLSQTTTSQTIMNHVRNCRRCPIEIRENLEIMKRNRMGSADRKRPNSKPKHGGRKVFFHRLWCRIQDIPFEVGKAETKESKKRSSSKTGSALKKKKRNSKSTSDSDDSEEDNSESEEETATESEESLDDEQSKKPKAKQKSGPSTSSKKKAIAPWHHGCVRLTKSDDPHWLSEMECFARSDLVEIFSLKKKDSLDGYSGRKEPALGQIGIRCIFCKILDPSERPNGYMCFPDSMSSIPNKVADLIRLHFPTCPSMPADHKETFKAFRGYDSKVANDDSQQYWVDSARDIGVSNTPAASGHGAWGVTFRRDPLQPSPADELDLELANNESGSWGMNYLVNPSDRGLCTDQVLLLLRQVRPCRFKKSDRRAGPGSRGRDRSMGFPGLACMHCANKNTLGRYFPVTSKNLTDNTVNSLQSHASSCSRCPEPIKASLAYLSHRSILQKAELSGSWKRTYFKKVWERLHVDRAWTPIDDELDDDEDDESSVEEQEENDQDSSEDEENEDGDEGSASEKEESGGQMSALIQAAAIWLTEQDQTTDSSKLRATKGRTLPGKRSGGPSSSGSKGGRGATSLPTKRRRVHS